MQLAATGHMQPPLESIHEAQDSQPWEAVKDEMGGDRQNTGHPTNL
jgi:hypothetical protein